jgi:hypothetical protein
MCIIYAHTLEFVQVLSAVSWDDLSIKFYSYLFEEEPGIERMFVTDR